MRLSIVFAVLLLAPFGAPRAQLLTPEDGVWWNPNEPGRGFVIETQNGTMVVGTYAYDAAGNAQWYLSAGSFSTSTRRFSATLDASRAGQCLGCPYRVAVPGTGGGPITIQFNTAVSGTLSAAGVTIPIQRFYYGYNGLDSFLFGAWVMSQQTFSLVSADWLLFNRTTPAPSGNPYVVGNRDSDPGSIALGRFEPALSKFLVLLDSSASFWRAYEFDMNKRSMVGRSWLYPKGSTLSGPGVPFVGNRLLDRAELVAGLAAADSKRAAQAERDLAEWRALAAGPAPKVGTAAPPALQASAWIELEQRLLETSAQAQ